MKKITMNTFKKLSKEQLVRIVEKVENVQVIYSPRNQKELVNKVVNYYNQGLVDVKDLI